MTLEHDVVVAVAALLVWIGWNWQAQPDKAPAQPSPPHLVFHVSQSRLEIEYFP